jgi:hypothetical protein
MSAWRIVGEPVVNELPAGGADAVDWIWEIERDAERRTVTIRMSRTLLGSTGHASEDAASARETQGRNYVEAVLDQDDPPRRREANTARTLANNLVDSW